MSIIGNPLDLLFQQPVGRVPIGHPLMPGHRPFHVIGGRTIRALLRARHHDIVRLIGETYRLHHAGRTSNPDSYFLRFADKPTARIIALPARVQGDRDVAGIKWISSFPENRARGLERASAAILLNDMATGFPYACLEASAISAARTAASATLAAEFLHQGKQAATLSVIGTGPIAAAVVDFLLGTGWQIGRFRVHDLVAARAARVQRAVARSAVAPPTRPPPRRTRSAAPTSSCSPPRRRSPISTTRRCSRRHKRCSTSRCATSASRSFSRRKMSSTTSSIA